MNIFPGTIVMNIFLNFGTSSIIVGGMIANESQGEESCFSNWQPYLYPSNQKRDGLDLFPGTQAAG